MKEEYLFATKEDLIDAFTDIEDNIIYVAPDCLGDFKEGDVVWKASFNKIHRGTIKVATEEDLAKRKYRYTGEIWGDEDCLYRTKEELIELSNKFNKTDMKSEKTKGYVAYPPKYSENIYSEGMGLYSHKSSDLTLALDIIHNIPLQAYNFDRRLHIDLSLLSVIHNYKLIEQAVDIVMESFNIMNGYPKEITKTGVVVHTKRELLKSILANKKRIYLVYPRENASSVERVDFYKKMNVYINDYIVPLIKRKAIKKLRDLVKVL